jgi:pyruvate dehydrogenase E1 component alpha subunit
LRGVTLKENNFKIANKFEKLSRDKKIEMLRKMYEIRYFEVEVDKFVLRGMIYGTCHLYTGEEASAVGAISAIDETDYIVSTHRGHGHCIAKGADLNIMMAELLGKGNGYCKGKGGSMHIADLDSNNLGANGIVGGGLGIAAGAALTCTLKKNNRVVIGFFGDGASNEGLFHEALNLASIWKLPVIYLCENNQYGMSTSVKESMNIDRVSKRAASYGIDGITIDGNNVIEVYNTVSHFAKRCREGVGTVLIESLTYRWRGHSKHDSQVYRTKEEVEEWKKLDPIKKYKEYLIENKLITEEEDKEIENTAIKEIKNAVAFAEKSEYPDISEVEKDVYSD